MHEPLSPPSRIRRQRREPAAPDDGIERANRESKLYLGVTGESPVVAVLAMVGARKRGIRWDNIAYFFRQARLREEARRLNAIALGAELALTVAEYRLAHPAMTVEDVAAAIGAMRSMLADDGDLLA